MVIPVSATFVVRAANEADLVAVLKGSAKVIVCSSLANHVAVDGRRVKLTVDRGPVVSHVNAFDRLTFD